MLMFLIKSKSNLFIEHISYRKQHLHTQQHMYNDMSIPIIHKSK